MALRGTWALALALSLAPAAATAQPRGAPPDDAARAEARRHFNHALALIGQARWRDAIRELEATRRTVTTPAVLFNLGLAHRALGEHRAAIASFREFLRLAGDRPDVEGRAEAEAFITELEGALGRVTIRTEPEDAAVTLDGEALAGSREAVPLDPGRHEVAVAAPGHQPATRVVEAAAGEHPVIVVRLVPVAARAPGDPRARAPSSPHPRRAAPSSSVFESGWFWGGVGLAMVALGVGLGIALAPSDPEPWGRVETTITLDAP